MDKLISKFENIFLQEDKWMKDVYKDCAEEAKEIAIEFALWKSEQPKRIIKLSDYPDTITAGEIYRIELEKEFEQFIEEYYV